MKVQLFLCLILTVLVGFVNVQVAESQQDSLIVLCENPYPESSTVHIPVFARINERSGVGLTGLRSMFHNDHPGLYISSSEWNGTGIGEEQTAIQWYVGAVPAWLMNNACADSSCRGGHGWFTTSEAPSVPSGHHLLFWLVVETGAPGNYLIEPRDTLGTPPHNYNEFWYFWTPSYPELVGCSIIVGEASFVRGDAQEDGDFDIYDGLSILSWLGGMGPAPLCIDAADVEDDGDVDIFDSIRLFNWLGGVVPPPPSPCCDMPGSCGPDPTPDELTCGTFSPCYRSGF